MSFFKELARLEEEGKSVAICTVVQTQGSTPRHEGSKMLVYPDGQITGTVGGGGIEDAVIKEALSALEDGRSRLLHYNMISPERGDVGLCGGQVDVVVEPLLPKPVLLIIGGGHVGRTVAHLGRWMGFRVVVSDDRPEFCTPESVPDAHEFYPVAMQDLPKHFTIGPNCYVVLATRGVTVDIPGLPALLESPAAYIGVIGSKRRWITSRKGILEAGVAPEKIDRVHSPIGLEIRAETPEEIAISILAEIIMIRNGGNGQSMKYTPKESSNVA